MEHLFTRGLAVMVLCAAAGACSVVGYPSPAPPPPAASSSAGAPTEGSAARGRTYEVFGVRYATMASSEGYAATGVASWYGEEFHGRPTASGEPYDMHLLSAAHRALPLPTCARVTHLGNGREVVVRVNDRGPFAATHERIIDLSYGAARALAMVGEGVAPVRVEALSDRGC